MISKKVAEDGSVKSSRCKARNDEVAAQRSKWTFYETIKNGAFLSLPGEI